jgi:signal transduction histidine kinase
MFFNLKARIRSGYIIAFLFLLVSYFLIFYIIQQLVQGTEAVAHTYTIINKLESLKAEITDAETGVRGYLITKKERFLEPYDNAIRVIPVIYKDVKMLTQDNSYQQNKLDTLNMLIGKKLEYLNELRNYARNGLIVTTIVILEQGKNTMDSIRLYIARMKMAEESLMKKRSSSLSGVFNSTNMIAITSLVVALLTILYSIFIYNRENKAKEEADKKTKLYRVELEDKLKELKQVNAELLDLKQIEKFAASGRIARTIAHEVRNPLTNISLAAEQLNEATVPNEESALLLDMIRRNAGRIDQLVNDLLHSTRFAQLNFIRVNVSQLVDETLELAKDRIELNNVLVHKKYERDTCEVLVDAEKIKLGLLNIIVNAIEAMEKGKGVLTLTIHENGDKCVIEIHDNGSGMDDDTLQKIYEPYYTGKSKGMGLGLTHTQNIILNHRGNITVQSKPGWGTSFFVTLTLGRGGDA